MKQTRQRALSAAALGLLLTASTAWAQQPATMRLRGTIEAVDGHTLTLKSRDGDVKLTLADNARIVAVIKAALAEIREGTFLGSAAIPQADGSQKAVEVHIFPESMRGTGEGHRPYPPVTNGTMTNGTASGALVAAVDGSVITVKYKDGEKRIIVGADVPIMR
jgi:hypothetical protein